MIAIIDLDGVLADATARFALAEQTANMKYQKELSRGSWTDLYWRTVFTSEHVALDTLIEGVTENLWQIEYQGFGLVYLTSRPESMREATETWLDANGIDVSHPAFGNILFMKPSAFQYTKTIVWKTGMVQMLAAMFEADEVLFVDDEQANISELTRYEHPFQLRTAISLDSAVNGEPDESENDSRF